MRAEAARSFADTDAMDGADEGDGPSHTVLTFDLGGQTVGVSVAYVREILDLQPVTGLPKAPTVVEGVIDVRGASVPVFDLSPVLGLAAMPPGPDSRLIVFEQPDGRAFAVRAEKVRDVFRIEPEAIERPPDLPGHGVDALLLGLCRRDGALVVLLAAEHLFDRVGRGIG